MRLDANLPRHDKNQMKILLASSETTPYSKSGGLADMVGALGKFLARAGHEVGLVTPLYRNIEQKFPDIRRLGWKLDIPLGAHRVSGEVLVHKPAKGLTFYFIDQKPFYNRPGLYNEKDVDYPDNAERFIFFTKAVVNLARFLPSQPEILHLHDWQCALAAALIRDQKLRQGWNGPAVCMTVHNLAFQGVFPASKFSLTGLPWNYFQANGLEFYGGFSCLKAGINYADIITTVSPRYAREITTPQFGCGLDGLLRERENLLVGILNGVDYEEWKTVGNAHLTVSYSADDLAGKETNKAELQKETGLQVNPAVPLFGTVSRLTDQKGMDLELAALQEMLAGNIQFVLLGSGSPDYERAFRQLADRYPGKCAVKIGFDTGLSHRIEAGCDFYLMPSAFEPCGLNQMYSLRYGTVPIVRATGGLDDAVTDITQNQELANGIKFTEYSPRALTKAIRKALALYEEKPLLEHFRRNGMTKDFSWERTANEYEAVYQRMLSKRVSQ